MLFYSSSPTLVDFQLKIEIPENRAEQNLCVQCLQSKFMKNFLGGRIFFLTSLNDDITYLKSCAWGNQQNSITNSYIRPQSSIMLLYFSVIAIFGDQHVCWLLSFLFYLHKIFSRICQRMLCLPANCVRKGKNMHYVKKSD